MQHTVSLHPNLLISAYYFQQFERRPRFAFTKVGGNADWGTIPGREIQCASALELTFYAILSTSIRICTSTSIEAYFPFLSMLLTYPRTDIGADPNLSRKFKTGGSGGFRSHYPIQYPSHVTPEDTKASTTVHKQGLKSYR